MNDEELICGNCKCYTAFRFDAEVGRCRKYNIVTQLRTECLNRKEWKCKCMNTECMEKRNYDRQI